MSDIESEGEIIYKAQRDAVDRGRIESLVARAESLEMKFDSLRLYVKGEVQQLANKVDYIDRTCLGFESLEQEFVGLANKVKALEERLSDDAR